MSRSSQLADVIFSEATLAHLAAAALLSGGGRRIVVLQGHGVGDVPPWAVPPLGLLPPAGPETLLEDLFRGCDLPPPVRRAFRTPPVLLQVIWPGFRADVMSDPQEHRAALEREFGREQAERIERFTSSLDDDFRALRKALIASPVYPNATPLARLFGRTGKVPGLPGAAAARLSKPLSTALAEAGLDENARLFVRLWVLGASHLFEGDPTLAAASFVLCAEQREHALLPPADTPELRDLLAVQLLKRDVRFVEGTIDNAERSRAGLWEIETEARAWLTGRVLVDGENELIGRLVKKGRRLCRTRTLRLVLDPKAVPVGMCPRGVALEDPRAPLAGGNLLVYALEPPLEEGGPARLWVSVLEGDAAGDEEGPPGRVKERVLGHLRRILPFLEEFLAKSGWLPLSEHAGYWSAAPKGLGIAGPTYRETGKNHFILGRSNLPTLGAWGELKAAGSVARLVAAALEKLEKK